jgi:hypothetical protein
VVVGGGLGPEGPGLSGVADGEIFALFFRRVDHDRVARDEQAGIAQALGDAQRRRPRQQASFVADRATRAQAAICVVANLVELGGLDGVGVHVRVLHLSGCDVSILEHHRAERNTYFSLSIACNQQRASIHCNHH